MQNGKPDWKWWVSVVMMAIGLAGGWMYTIGIARAQVTSNSEALERHEKIPYHGGVLEVTAANARRITKLEITAGRIDEKLNAILKAIEKNHR